MKRLLVDANQFAFRLDSRERSSYPILLDSDHPDELAHRFFGIPYYKGAALIRMMDGFLTSKTLRSGISRYLKRWAFKAAVQDNLFEALQEQAVEDGIELPNNLTVTDIMNGWTKQRGFPVIRVVTKNSSAISIIQVQNHVRILEQGKTKKLQEQALLSWHVPISIASADEPDFSNHLPKIWIPKDVALVNVDVDTSKWLVINPDATGYFRVHYDENIASLLREQLNTDHSVISPMTRSQLLDDYFNFATEGELQISKALEFTTYFGNETEEIVWHILLSNLRRLHYFYREYPDASSRNTSRSLPAFQGLRDYLLPRLEGALMKIGFEQSPEDRGIIITTRSRLLTWACRLGSQMCFDYANNLFVQWMNSPEKNPVPLDLQDFMYCYGVRAGGGRNWLFAVDQFAKATNLLQSLRLAKSLTCIEDEDVLNVFMDSVIDKETLGVSKEEFLVIFESLSSNPSRRHLAIKFLRTRLPAVIRYLNGTRSVNVLFSLLTDYLHTEEDLLEVQKIYSENLPQILMEKDVVDIDEHVTDIKDNIQWMAKYYQPMREWFDSQTREDKRKQQQQALAMPQDGQGSNQGASGGVSNFFNGFISGFTAALQGGVSGANSLFNGFGSAANNTFNGLLVGYNATSQGLVQGASNVIGDPNNRPT
ncbi:Aminopeptidase N [Orchesella cincta]|uniref:Aminopeptidase N n=1 Tax=Orchesella cincta TaxID=48709 RepID=A0A1D2MNW8_ORCCI|nr:Aminopeptidase N [Orchesella cincta]